MMIYKAIHTAIKAHEHQVRKLDNDMYVAHPLEVGITLAKYGFSDEIIIAGILHDTIEDTDLVLKDIERAFGPVVSLYVDYCIEQNKADTWKNRKDDYLKQLSDAPIDVLYIVCADKLTNIKSIARNLEHMGTSIWDKFNADYENQKWYYYAVLDTLSPIYAHPLYVALKQVIDSVFSH